LLFVFIENIYQVQEDGIVIENREIGRTGMKASVIGLGAGGNSRLGLSTGQDEAHAAQVVRDALDMGITIVDTAHYYRTQPAIGQALQAWSDGDDTKKKQVVISTKGPYRGEDGKLLTVDNFQENIDNSLRELQLETIDIYFIHGLNLKYYEQARDRFLPVLQKNRQEGKIRFTGVTEGFESDTRHDMLQAAVQDEGWDVVMVGFNILNPSARERVLSHTRRRRIGTLGMFAVRRALIDEVWLRVLLKRMHEEGEIDAELVKSADLMESLGLKGVCDTLAEAAYRFCAYEPGMDCVLSGTSNSTHLAANIKATQKGPLPEATLRRLDDLFGKVDSVSAQVR